MRLAIMQPYLFPYIGYFQLMKAADEFVVYDDIEYTKKGWINRNRILVNGKDEYISVPLKKDSDYRHVRERCLAETWPAERKKLLNKIKEVYRKAPQFAAVYPLIESAILFEESNLFPFILNSLTLLKDYCGIGTPLVVSSSLSIDPALKAERKVLQICKECGADAYINPIGGVELYNKEAFKAEGVDLFFLKTSGVEYKQYNNDFVPFLSIIDVLMFNPEDRVQEYLDSAYELL